MYTFFFRWWDCIALPDDVHSCDEAAFRAQIKELAFTVILSHLDSACTNKESCLSVFLINHSSITVLTLLQIINYYICSYLSREHFNSLWIHLINTLNYKWLLIYKSKSRYLFFWLGVWLFSSNYYSKFLIPTVWGWQYNFLHFGLVKRHSSY